MSIGVRVSSKRFNDSLLVFFLIELIITTTMTITTFTTIHLFLEAFAV